MPDIQNKNQPVATQSSTAVPSLSPWEEPLPTESKKSETIGTLAPEDQRPISTLPPAAFALPENPENNVVPKSLTPDDLASPDLATSSIGPISSPSLEAAAVSSIPALPPSDPGNQSNSILPNESSVGEAKAKETDNKFVTKIAEIQPAVPNSVVAAIEPVVKSENVDLEESLPDKLAPTNIAGIGLDLAKKDLAATQPLQPSIPDKTEILAPVAVKKNEVAQSIALESATAEEASKPATSVPEVSNLGSKVSSLVKNLVHSKSAIATDIMVAKPQSPAPSVAAIANNEEPKIETPLESLNQTSPVMPASVPKSQFALKIAPKKLWLAGSIIGVVALFSLLTVLTETGLISIGLERAYGAVNLQSLWGGLPMNGEFALAKSFSVMKDNPNFKMAGTIVADIDRTKDSKVTKPLVSFFPDIYAVIPIEKANLAIYTGYDVSGSSTDLNDTATSTNTTANTGVSASGTSVTTPSVSNVVSSSKQEDFPSYQNITSTIKQLSADVTGEITDKGSSMKFSFRKPVGSTEVEVRQMSDNIWVKSKIAFSTNQDANKWMEMELKGPKTGSQSVVESLFNASPNDGLSASGTRVGNEKVGKTRTYHYNFKSLEIGDSLASLGIRNEMVDSISGDFWIGVKDSLIKKVELKITPTPSYSITMLRLSLEFDDYGNATFSKPSPGDILAASFTTIAAPVQ